MSNAFYRGRIAPTPSGFLHEGHLETFKTAYSRAKEARGALVLRIEDIDKDRCKPEYVAQCVKDLKRFGIVCTEGYGIGGQFAPYLQSERFDLYRQILVALIKKGLAYPCNLSRKEIAQSCPLSRYDAGERVFDKSLIDPSYKSGTLPDNFDQLNWRFNLNYAQTFAFADAFEGAQEFTAGADFGDFLVWRRQNAPSYELAVVVDDHFMQISEVVRGKDLLLSTAKQMAIYNAFGWKIPAFAHCKLLLGKDGKKLSKSVMKKSDPNLLINRR